jgi:hypothetical protein
VRSFGIAYLAALVASSACSSSSPCNSPGTAGTGVSCGPGTAGTTGNAGSTGSAGSAGTTGGGNAGSGGTTGGAGTGGAVDAGADVAQLAFEEQVLEIASNYVSWGRVDDELRWAPGLCRQPYPGVAHQSTSNDPTTHGQKLYSLFAKNWANYPNGPHDGQAVVKQSWKVEQVTAPDASFNPGMFPLPNDDGDHFYPYAKGPDGGVFHATEPAGLFIMFKLDSATPETDEGWVYATVSTEGRVTSAGRVATCMGCHESSATHERLYGVSKSPSL